VVQSLQESNDEHAASAEVSTNVETSVKKRILTGVCAVGPEVWWSAAPGDGWDFRSRVGMQGLGTVRLVWR
jgi:hypothetical protein